MTSLTLPKASQQQLRGKPVAGIWRLRETYQGQTLELFRFGGSWSPASPAVRIHPHGAQSLLLDNGEVFAPESR